MLRFTILIGLAFLVLGCTKQPEHNSKPAGVWLETEVTRIIDCDYKKEAKGAGIKMLSSDGSDLNPMRFAIQGIYNLGVFIGNSVAYAADKASSLATEGEGVRLTLIRTDMPDEDIYISECLRVASRSDNNTTSIYLDGADKDIMDIEIHAHLAGMFNHKLELLQLSSDLTQTIEYLDKNKKDHNGNGQ